MLVLFVLRAVLVRLQRTTQAVRDALGFPRIEEKQGWVEGKCDAHEGGVAAFYNPTRVGAAERDDSHREQLSANEGPLLAPAPRRRCPGRALQRHNARPATVPALTCQSLSFQAPRYASLRPNETSRRCGRLSPTA